MAKGYIYIMTNPALKDMVKIGYTIDIEKRRKDLSTTSLPYDYEIYAVYETPVKLGDKKIHSMIDNLNPDLRVTKNREFFIMTPEDAFKLLEAIATISGTRDKLKKAEDASIKPPKQFIKKPALNFRLCGIPEGAELVFKEDPSITVTVVGERKVLYKDEITSLSALAKELKGFDHGVQGTLWFTYNGKPILDIAKETQWKDYR